MLPVGHCQVPAPLRLLQAETTVVGSQQGLRCGSICPVTTGQESVVNRCATSPRSVQISHPRRQGPSTQETILSDHPQQCTVLPRCCLSGRPWRLAWHQRSSGSMPFEYAVDGSTSQTHTGSNSTLLNALTVKCKHLMPNTHLVGRGIVRTIRKAIEKICKYWFKSCHSVKIDLGERPPILWFRSSTIPLDLTLNVCPRLCRISLGNNHGSKSCQFQPSGNTKVRSTLVLLSSMGVWQLFCQECITCRQIICTQVMSKKLMFSPFWCMFLHLFPNISCTGLLPDTWNCGLRLHRECRVAYRDRRIEVSFEVGGGEAFPGIPGACAIRTFSSLIRGPWESLTALPETSFELQVGIS